MKKAISILICSMLSFSAISQKVFNRIVDEMCDCINKIDPELEDPVALDEEAEKCIGVVMYHAGDLKKKGYDLMDEDGVGIVMEKVMTMALEECPRIISIVAKIEGPPKVEYDKSIVLDSAQCKVLHSGEFLYVSEFDSTLYTMDGDTQIAHDLKTNTTSEFDVEWLNDCEYVLTYRKGGTEKVKEFYKISKECACSIVAVDEERVVTSCTILDVNIEFEMKILE